MAKLKDMPQPSSKTTDFSAFVQDAERLLNRCVELLRSKASDYADGHDAFINFKTAAQVAGISPEQTLLTLLGMKISRLTQLVGKNKTAKHESSEDTMLDIINYVLLLRGMLQEQRPETTPVPSAVPMAPPVTTQQAVERPLPSFSQAAPNLLQ